MHYYKRIGGLIYIILLSAGVLFNLNLYAANNPDDVKTLDSVYNAYINLRGMHPQSLIPGVTSVNGNDRKCSFGLVSYLYNHKNELSLSRQKVLSALDQRPELEKSIVSPSGKFRIHFNSTGSYAPAYDPGLSISDNVYQVALAFDSAYSYENNYLGYKFPPGDHGLGGDDLYDIYIVNEGGSEYGATLPDDQIFDNPTSFINIDNDFSKQDSYNTTGFNGMRVTAAHEFHHAIQVGSYGGFPQGNNENFFYELTSTSMEEFVYNTINDYYFYLRDYFSGPSRSFPQYDGYGEAIWNIYLVKKYGFTGQLMIRRQWELKAAGVPIFSAINTSLLEHASSFKQALNEYGTWMYFTGYRKAKDTKNEYFDEGANYPTINLYDISYSPPSQSVDFFIKPLSNTFKKFTNKSQTTYRDTIVIITTNADYDKAENNPGEDIDAQDILSGSSFDGSNRLSDSYFWKTSSSDNNFTSGTAILNNIPPDKNISPLANNDDEAYPLPFSYQNNVDVFIPAFYNDTRYAELKIFSVSMNLVFSKNESISKDINNNFVVTWNGMDSKNHKLPTGVYIYVTSSDDKIKTGKLVIKNE
jgi:hypothetical protein